jgi:hypothetical protein
MKDTMDRGEGSDKAVGITPFIPLILRGITNAHPCRYFPSKGKRGRGS